MDISFKDKRVLVTGGVRGIGKAIASQFHQLGAEVHITGTTPEPSGKSPAKINYHMLDFLKKHSFEFFLRDVVSKYQFDILVNNAGMNKIDVLPEITCQDFENVLKVNTIGPFKLTQALTNRMPDGGRVINIGSIWSHITKKGRVSYSTSKAGILGLTRGLSVDLAKRNILVNCLSPGFVDTELTQRSLSAEDVKELVDMVPLGRLASPDEISKAVIFLCSDLNSFITGQNLIIDGGFSNV